MNSEIQEIIHEGWLIFAFTTIAYLYDKLTSPYFEFLGFSTIQISWIFIISLIFYILLAPIIGTLSDHIGRTKFIRIGLTLLILQTGLYIFFPTNINIVIAKTFGTIAWISTFYLAIVGLEKHTKSKKRGSFTGKIFSLNKIPFLIAPFLGGYLADKYSITTPFFIAMILWIILLLFTFKLKENKKRKIKKQDLNYLKDIKLFLKNKKMRWIGITGFWVLAIISIIAVFLPLHILHTFGQNYTLIGLAFTFFGIGTTTQFLIGKVTDKKGRLQAISIGMFIMGLALILAINTTNYLFFIILILICGMGNSAWAICAWSMMSDFGKQKKGEIGKIIGSYLSISRIGSLTGILVGGYLTLISTKLSFIIFSTFLIVTSLMFYIKTKNLPKIPQ